jgi:hypothetical protein
VGTNYIVVYDMIDDDDRQNAHKTWPHTELVVK